MVHERSVQLYNYRLLGILTVAVQESGKILFFDLNKAKAKSISC